MKAGCAMESLSCIVEGSACGELEASEEQESGHNSTKLLRQPFVRYPSVLARFDS